MVRGTIMRKQLRKKNDYIKELTILELQRK